MNPESVENEPVNAFEIDLFGDQGSKPKKKNLNKRKREEIKEPLDDEPPTKKVKTTNIPKWTIWVGHLPLSTDDQKLRNIFEGCGEIHSVKMVVGNGNNKRSKFAYVQFLTQEGQMKALEKNGENILKKKIQIRKYTKCKWYQVFIENCPIESELDLKNELKTLGTWKIGGLRVQKGTNWFGKKYAFVFFRSFQEANKFYDDMKDKKIRDSEVHVEFPKNAQEVREVKTRLENNLLDRARRTAILTDLDRSTNVDDIRSSYEALKNAVLIDIPAKNGQAFIEFETEKEAQNFIKNHTKFKIKGNEFHSDICLLSADHSQVNEVKWTTSSGEWMQWYQNYWRQVRLNGGVERVKTFRNKVNASVQKKTAKIEAKKAPQIQQEVLNSGEIDLF